MNSGSPRLRSVIEIRELMRFGFRRNRTRVSENIRTPKPALVVLMIPIVLNTAADARLSPHALTMAIAITGSGTFCTPVSRPASLLVMGLGGYQLVDFVRFGEALSLVLFSSVLMVLPWFRPLRLADGAQ